MYENERARPSFYNVKDNSEKTLHKGKDRVAYGVKDRAGRPPENYSQTAKDLKRGRPADMPPIPLPEHELLQSGAKLKKW